MKDWAQDLARIPLDFQEPKSPAEVGPEQDPIGASAVGQSAALPPGRAGEQDVADAATRGNGRSLPFVDLIQEAFGKFDVREIESFVGPAATMACQRLQANAFASAGMAVFNGTPDLRTAVHEALHALFQRSGVGPESGRGQRADTFEAQAERVAQAVVEGGNAEALIEQILGPDALDQMGDAWRGLQLDGPDAERRTPGADAESTPGGIPEGGTEVGRPGIVNRDSSPQLRMRSEPDTSSDNVVRELEFNTRVTVIKSFASGWLFISTAEGETGYVATPYIWYENLPEPNAQLHRVQAGVPGTAIAIAEQYYQDGADDWGQDLRFYVNVLAYANSIEIPNETDGWRQVQFQANQFIWIPSVEFARSLQGVVNSGSWSYNAADAVGLADTIERAGEIWDDFGTAIELSGQYMLEAIAQHSVDAIINALVSLAMLLVGAALVLALSTAVGAAIGAIAGAGAGAAPGAAAGFEVGIALIEWLGLAFLVAFIVDAAVRIGGAFATFIGTVFSARGDRQVLDQAGRELANAVGTLIGVLIEAIVMLAAARGIGWVMGRMGGTRMVEGAGEGNFRNWLGERVTNVQQGEGPLPTPRDAYGRMREGRAREGEGTAREGEGTAREGEGRAREEGQPREEGRAREEGRGEEPAFREEAVRPTQDGAEVASGARQVVVGRHLTSEQEGLALIQRLAAGERSALTELGVRNVPENFNTTSTEWGLGRTPDGRFLIIRGRSGHVNWADFPGVEARAHSHPYRPFQGESSEGFPIEAMVRGEAEAGGMANQVQFMPSASDLGFMARNGIRGHIVQTPYVEVAPGRVGSPAPGTSGQAPITIEIVSATRAGSMGEIPVYEANLVVRNGAGEVMWQGQVQGANNPYIGDMISTESLLRLTEGTSGRSEPGVSERAPERTPEGGGQTRAGQIVREAIDSSTTPEEALAMLRSVLSENGRRGLDAFARPDEAPQSVLDRLLAIEGRGQDVARILEARGARAAQAEAASARVQAEGQRLIDEGFLDQPGVRTAIQGRQPQPEVRGIIAETLAEGAARSRVAGTAEASVIANVKVAREVPGYRTVQEWAADHPGQNPARYFEHEGKLWDSMAEADLMTVRQTPEGRLRITELEEVKSGRNDSASGAQQQLTGLIEALRAVAQGDASLRIFQMEGKHTVGRDMTPYFDLGGVEGVATRTTGPAGTEGFDSRIEFTTNQLNEMATFIIRAFNGGGE
ncbi:MAG: SH3 domain-containing protein [Bradymonadia bacterium]